MAAVAVPVELPRVRPSQRERHLRVVPARQQRVRLLALLGVLLTVGSLFMLVVINSEIAQGQFQLSNLDQRLEAQQLRNERLRFDVARLASPDAIVTAAQAQGLVVPQSIDWVVAPEAAPKRDAADRTSLTLADTYAKSKSSLGPNP